jgi:hypothetical protein
MRRLNKRGMDDKLMFIMWEFIVIVMVFVVLTMSVRGIANDTTYWKKYHSADLALMTDLIMANQGDVTINYDMKTLRQSFVAKAMLIDPLKFQIFMKEDSFFIYDQSIDKDRFPQSFIFAKDKDIKVQPSNTTDYVILYKKEGNVGMTTNSLSESISCPAQDTTGNLSQKSFGVLALSDGIKAYSDYINSKLLTIGKGSNNEVLFALATSSTAVTTIYYDGTLNQVSNKKMACLIQRRLLQKFPDMDITIKPYDNSFEIEPFVSQKDKYMYWILININTTMITNMNISDSIAGAIGEYYG